MLKNQTKHALCLALVLSMTGCASTRSVEQDNKTHRTRNVLIAVGATIAAGVLMGKKAQENAIDAATDGSNP